MKNEIADDVELIDGNNYTGTVSMFDEHVGLGEIIVHNKGILTTQKIPFHCVNISNGSRRIALEERVGFVAHFHPMGRFEAIEIEPLTGFVDFGGAPMF